MRCVCIPEERVANVQIYKNTVLNHYKVGIKVFSLYSSSRQNAQDNVL